MLVNYSMRQGVCQGVFSVASWEVSALFIGSGAGDRRKNRCDGALGIRRKGAAGGYLTIFRYRLIIETTVSPPLRRMIYQKVFDMEKDLERAVSLLGEEYTCVLCRGEEVLTTTARGVRPLLQWLDGGVEPGFSAADRVVGRGAAFLYRLLGVKAVYARVVSEPALRVLEDGGIAALPERVVPGIVNRAGDGPCPFEAAVLHITEPGEALLAIREKMAALSLRSGK